MFVRLWLVNLAWYFDFRLHHFAWSLAVLCSPILLNPGCPSGKLQNDRLVLHSVWSSGTGPASAVWTPVTSPLSLNPAPVAQERETFWLSVWWGRIVWLRVRVMGEQTCGSSSEILATILFA